jgi:hydroxymethylpyrimidine pyrophosphatase-like HAD family hydrolase
VCFDLDGCIATYSGWKGFDKIGRPIKATIEAMRELWNRGFYITIFTTRPDTPKMRKWLEKNDVPFHSINSNSHNPPTTSQKPIYHCMVDDRAVRYRGQNCYELLKDIAEVMKTDIF